MKSVRIGKKHTPLVVGNWKMNPSHITKASELALSLKKGMPKKSVGAEVAIAVPFPFLSEVQKKIAKTRMKLAAQDVSFEDGGAHTGEISLPMLHSVGVSMVIAGHSERRAQGENDSLVAQKAVAILKGGAVAVVCIGETVRDKEGDYFTAVEMQLRSVLKEVKSSWLSRLVIAYEPVWAIGTGKHANAEDVQEMKLFIQKVIAEVHTRSAVGKVRILYGGSVTKDNAQELFQAGHADGFLVGGASLKASEFCEIVRLADIHAST